MSELQRVLLLIVILTLSAGMAILQMAWERTVPIEFWAVIYAVLGSLGIAVAWPAVKAGATAVKTGAKRVGKILAGDP